jgi:hypothetical protein
LNFLDLFVSDISDCPSPKNYKFIIRNTLKMVLNPYCFVLHSTIDANTTNNTSFAPGKNDNLGGGK